MSKSRQHSAEEDVPSSSPTSMRSREWDGPSRWTEYLGQEIDLKMTSKSSINGGFDGSVQSSVGSTHKGLNMLWVYQLTQVAEGLMAKMYRLNQILDYPDVVSHVYSETFWKSGLFPNHPKICILLAKKFPEHHCRLQLERVRVWIFYDFKWLVFLHPDGVWVCVLLTGRMWCR